jgi:prepilin-type N-terminal cleavage/methylation domain-containing protein
MRNLKIRNQDGFTMIELIACLVILSVVFAVASKKYMGMQEIAKTSAAIQVCHDLNGRESGLWAGTLISGEYKSDTDVYVQLVVYTSDLNWESLTKDGGVLFVDGQRFALRREPSQLTTSARWSYQDH